ncbi:Zinc finger CCHC-type [Trinorchestia longiramus]|nr:Zinc finger CCHC-type [Trinorchestia longiramus]
MLEPVQSVQMMIRPVQLQITAHLSIKPTSNDLIIYPMGHAYVPDSDICDLLMRQLGGGLNFAEIKIWANKFRLKKKLFNMKLENGQNLQDHLKVFVELLEELAIIGDARVEDERVIILLSSLPDRCSTLVTALEAHEKIPAWEVVTERLLNEERRQRGGLGTSDSSEKLLVSFKRNKKLIKCFECGKEGHIKRQCRAVVLNQGFGESDFKPVKFSLQLDEITDVSNVSQLAVLVHYVKDVVLNEDFLFCKPLTTTTKATEVKKLVDNFFKDNSLSWDMVSVVCSDRVPVTLGRKSGFGAVVKADAPHIIVTHCILYRHALATKTVPPKLAEVLKIVDCVNYSYMQSSAPRHRIFSELCKEMGSEFEVLLYHFNIRWLSRGQVLNRVFAVRVELALFLQEYQQCHADCFKN